MYRILTAYVYIKMI